MITIRGCTTLKGAALMDEFMEKLKQEETGGAQPEKVAEVKD